MLTPDVQYLLAIALKVAGSFAIFAYLFSAFVVWRSTGLMRAQVSTGLGGLIALFHIVNFLVALGLFIFSLTFFFR